MTGQWKFNKNNRQIEFNIYSSLSIDMKTQFSPQLMNVIASRKNIYYSLYIFLTKPTIVKKCYISFSNIIPKMEEFCVTFEIVDTEQKNQLLF